MISLHCLWTLPIFQKCLIKYFKKKHACVENIQVQGKSKTNSTYQLRVVNVRCRILWPANCQSLSNWQRMSKSHNHKINHKLIKPSFHPFARCLRREFLLFFIDMRGSYVVCEFPQVSTSPLCVVGTYKYRTNSSRQSSYRSSRLERFFHAPCPESISKMTKSSASMSSLMVIIPPNYFLTFQIV